MTKTVIKSCLSRLICEENSMNKYDFEMTVEAGTKPALIMEQITSNCDILEFGCANGRMTKYLKEQKNCRVSIIELEEAPFSEAIRYAADGLCTNIETGEWIDYFSGKQFDYIIFADVLEHLRTAEKTLKEAKQFLKDDGKIIISIPNIAHNDIIAQLFNNSFKYNEIGLLDNTHVHFWGEKELKELVSDTGYFLEIIDASYLAPFTTEFKDSSANIPEILKTILNNREYNEVYQFFLVLRKKEWAKENELKTDIRLKKFGSRNSATFYWDTGKGYQPELYSFIPCTENQGIRTFCVENIPPNCQKARFDPPASGSFFVENFRVVVNGSEECAITPLNGITINSNTYLFSNVHAQLEFPLPDTTSHFVVTAKITPCTEKDAEYIKQYLNELAEHNYKINTLTEENLNFRAFNQGLSEENNKLNSNNQLLNDENNNLRIYNQHLNEENNNLHSSNKRLNRDKELLENKLNELENKLNEAETTHQLLMCDYNALNVHAQELTKANKELTDTHKSLSMQYESIFAQYMVVINSQFWKITYPARLTLDITKRIIKNIPFVRIGYKGLVFLKNNGWRSFTSKVKNYFQAKRNLKTSDKLVVSTLNLTTKDKEVHGEYNTSVSIVIPTFNGGSELVLLVRNLFNQQGVKKIEVTIVDSGSTDNSIEICKQLGAKIINISQKEFSHSFARNLGAKHSSGKHLLFMTQDALPTSNYWLYNMLTPIMNNGVVAVSCDEFPRDYCDLYHRICNHVHTNYIGFANTDLICSMPDIVNFETLRKNGQLNDVACLIVKDVFMKHKYTGDYAEDLALGIKLIQSGHKLCLLSSERVIHSHTRKPGYYLKRAIVDVINLTKILPKYPSSSPTQEQAINKALSVYAVMCNLCNMVKSNIDVPINVDLFIKEFKSYMTLAVNNINLSNLKYGEDYSDDLCDKVLKTISTMTSDKKYDSALVNDVFYFFDNFVFSYIKSNYNMLDNLILTELINIVYNRTMVSIGAELANYFNAESNSTKLTKLINNLKKGV